MPTALGTIASQRTVTAPVGPPLTGMVGWWDAADAATITSSAGAVSQWNDKSGNARHLTQVAGAAYQPITGTRTINSKNALDFDGSNDQLRSAAYSHAPPFTMFAVVKSDIAATANRQIIGFITCPAIFGDTYWCIYSGGTFIQTSVVVDTNPHVLSSIFRNGAALSSIWLDGGSVATGNAGSGTWNSYISIGMPDIPGYNWDGLVAEVIIYERELTTPERQGVESYLKTKWGTP